MSVIVLNRSVIHYEALGRGRPVVFLHTWVGSWRYWVPSLQAAAVSHSAYALDLYGFGGSAREAGRYSIEGQAALVGGFLDEMGIDRTALVGHGLGGLVGLRFAANHPQRVARILAVGVSVIPGSADYGPKQPEPSALLASLDRSGAHAALLIPETLANDAGAARQGMGPEQVRALISTLQTAGIPMLIVNGAGDPLAPVLTPERLAGFGTHMHEILLPDAGHFPMLDSADAFHRLMIDFLALESSSSPRELRVKEAWRRRVR